MTGFLKFLLIFFLIIVALGYLVRYLIIRFLKKLQDKSSGNRDNYKRNEGEVTINGNDDKKKFHNSNDGEYIDYEEL